MISFEPQAVEESGFDKHTVEMFNEGNAAASAAGQKVNPKESILKLPLVQNKVSAVSANCPCIFLHISTSCRAVQNPTRALPGRRVDWRTDSDNYNNEPQWIPR